MQKVFTTMRIAFVHEYLNQFGGAERMLQVLSAMFPQAPIYTLIYDENLTGHVFEGRTIITSFLQKLPLTKNHHRLFPLLMPIAIEQFDFSDYDLVISISASFAKGIITKPETRHICYCLTPPRFLWDNSQKLLEEFGFPAIIKKLMPPFISYLRIWDQEASSRVDEFWSISNFVRDRVKKYYHADSKVIYPPVDTDKFIISPHIGDYYLMVGRLVPYKKFDLAIEAFNDLDKRLIIVGAGPELFKLKKIAKDNIEFLGLVTDDTLSALYSKAKALVFPQEEDFGIVPLEAMASGRPVLAFKGGGALETIIEGETGLFFDHQSSEAIKETIGLFEKMQFNSRLCRIQAEKFDINIFQNKIFKHYEYDRRR